LCANSPLRPYYEAFIQSSFSIGPSGKLSLTVAEWCSEGLLAIFFLLVGLEIRRETTAGALTDRRAAALPVVAAVGGVLVPAALYLALNHGPTAPGWSIPTATDIAFTLGILALLGDRIPPTLRVFVAALAVVDDVLSVLTLAIFYPHAFHLGWLRASESRSHSFHQPLASVCNLAGAVPLLWIAMHAVIHAALAGTLAIFPPTRPTPLGPLLAQAATALAALDTRRTKRGRRDARRLASSRSPSGIGQAATFPLQASVSCPWRIASSWRSRRGVRTSCCRSGNASPP
jgi:NhaA family Na+:H+ antiporter